MAAEEKPDPAFSDFVRWLGPNAFLADGVKVDFDMAVEDKPGLTFREYVDALRPNAVIDGRATEFVSGHHRQGTPEWRQELERIGGREYVEPADDSLLNS